MDLIDSIDLIVKTYGISSYSIEKCRSVYKVVSKDGNFVIKKFNSKDKMFNTKKIINHLRANNFKYIPNICYNLNDEFYFEHNNKYYACFTWIKGRELNIKNYREIKKSIKLVYLFHESAKNIKDVTIKLEDNSDWIDSFNKDIFNLYNIKDKIYVKSNKSDLDKFYYENADLAIKKLKLLINNLNESRIKNYLLNNKIICHNSLYYQNFILNKNKMYLIDFGGICINNKIYDIARFSKRIFYKNNLDFNLLDKVYNNFNHYYKFNNIEKSLFNCYLNYPYKFIKLGYRYYIKNKNISEEKLFKKLKKYYKYELILK